MNYIKSLLFIFVVTGVILCEAKESDSYSYVSIPKLDRGTLSFVVVPLLHETGDILFRDVPAKLFGPARDGVLEAMGSPVYPASIDVEERKKDINLISICRIGLSLKPARKEDEYILIIDLSKAVEPKGAKFTLEGVVQAVLTCIRVQFPPSNLGKVDVTIIKKTKDEKWSQFEGPLWPY